MVVSGRSMGFRVTRAEVRLQCRLIVWLGSSSLPGLRAQRPTFQLTLERTGNGKLADIRHEIVVQENKACLITLQNLDSVEKGQV